MPSGKAGRFVLKNRSLIRHRKHRFTVGETDRCVYVSQAQEMDSPEKVVRDICEHVLRQTALVTDVCLYRIWRIQILGLCADCGRDLSGKLKDRRNLFKEIRTLNNELGLMVAVE